jgi:hypothetical protein
MNKQSIQFASFLVMAMLFFSGSCFSANRYWVGSGLGDWNNSSNWSLTSGGAIGASVPGVSDIALFDGSNVTNCAITANVSVSGVTISGLYSGTISFNTGITALIGASGFSQSAGTVIGNNGSITITGAFNLIGGTFSSTSGVLQVTGGFSNTGVFNSNSGTIAYSGTQTITGNTTAYNLLFAANGGIYTIASGTTITSTNNVIISGGFACTINTGTVEIKGDLTLTSSANNSNNGGSATFIFNGIGVQNINSAIGSVIVGTNERICALPNVEINKLSGSLNLSGVITINGTFWKTTAGAALVNPGTSTVNIISSVTFSGQNLSLYKIHIWTNSQTIVLSPATYVLTSTNNVTINGGSHYVVNTGTLELLGDLTLIASSAVSLNGGTGTFLFDGTGIQTINSSVSSLNNECGLPNVQINKSSGALNLNGIINFSGGSWNTIAGASLINPGTSVVNLLKTTTLSGQDISLYDLMITGTFSFTTINTGLTWTSTHLLTLAGATSWYQINTGTLNAKGDVLITNTNTSNNVGGSATILFNGSSNQALTGSGVSGGGRLPNVVINKTGGTLTLFGLISTDNNWTYIAGTVDAVSNGSTVECYKTGVVDGQGTSGTMAFNHVGISGLITLGGALVVSGNFTIFSGVGNQLDITPANNYQVNIGGNWLNNNSTTLTSFNQRSGKVVFDGTGMQSFNLTSTAHIETFYQLEMNNSGSGITLNAPLTVSNTIHFILGKIISTVSNPVLLLNGATATGANNSSFVSGPVGKTGNQAFIFPVGKNLVYAPISISAPGVITNQFTAEYFQVNPDPLYSVTAKDVSLDHISTCEFWTLDQNSGTSGVAVTLSWDTRSCGITNPSDLRVARWNGALWNDLGNGGTTGTNAAGTVVSLASVTAFGPFTLASITNLNPLPIELISFTGRCDNRNIVLDWSTANEFNNVEFTAEHSTDGINWMAIGTIAGAGNSNTLLHYSFTCDPSTGNIDYYRLKQTDLNGEYNYSWLISIVNCIENSGSDGWAVYPNPTTGICQLEFEGGSVYRMITVYNEIQAVVFHSDVSPYIIDLSNQPEGVYFIQNQSDASLTTRKIVLLK